MPVDQVPGRLRRGSAGASQPSRGPASLSYSRLPTQLLLCPSPPPLPPVARCPTTLQLALASFAARLPWYVLVPLAYSVGGACNCNLQLAMHEISHNLAFKATARWGLALNRLLSIVANLPLGIPAAISFRKYHLEHHRYQGHDVVDVDIPCEWEGWFFQSPARKALWCFLQPAFYALRPVATNPKPLQAWEAVNIAVQLAFDWAVWRLLGAKALVYLVAGTLLGMGLHPTAYHFISEHCVFQEGHETYSYYGPLNAIMYNVGYHNEHHDFPNIPGSRLAQVRAMAPEFYDTLPYHTSWFKVYYDYIFSDHISPYSRVKRCPREGNLVAKKAK